MGLTAAPLRLAAQGPSHVRGGVDRLETCRDAPSPLEYVTLPVFILLQLTLASGRGDRGQNERVEAGQKLFTLTCVTSGTGMTSHNPNSRASEVKSPP